MKSKIVLFVIIGCIGLSTPDRVKGQDPLFTQFFSAPLYYNPAYTGIATGLRARFDYRNQWPNLTTPYRAYYFSADLGDRNLPGAGGIGLMVNSDNEGVGFIHNLELALDISVRIPITEFLVAQVGVKGSLKQKTINWNDFVVTDQLNEKYGNIYQTALSHPDANKRTYPDFAAGGILRTTNESGSFSGTLGFAVDHMFQPDESFLQTSSSPLPRKWIAHMDVVFQVGEAGSTSGLSSNGFGDPLKLNPGILFVSQSRFNTIEVGMNLMKFNVYLGGWYKTTLTGAVSNSFALLAGYNYRFAENMSARFIYSYDIPISGAMMGTGGAHELSIVIEFSSLKIFGGSSGGFRGNGSRKGYDYMECPEFY
ncbi:MAG: PorP/SprF family type IX secretion system membrane protein [Bacteroidetes bacterium]|nr:PorP/SprF family type IX secretion system membrane protein [Bacteroidota bacterium]